MNVDSPRGARVAIAVQILLCGVAVACNLLLPSGLEQIVRLKVWWLLGAFAGGALVAEVCLLGIWCGLSLQEIKYRLPVTVSLVLVVACSYSLGLQIMEDGMPMIIALLIGGAAFGMFVALQFPLWLLRRFSTCRYSLGLAATTLAVAFVWRWLGYCYIEVGEPAPETPAATALNTDAFPAANKPASHCRNPLLARKVALPPTRPPPASAHGRTS